MKFLIEFKLFFLLFSNDKGIALCDPPPRYLQSLYEELFLFCFNFLLDKDVAQHLNYFVYPWIIHEIGLDGQTDDEHHAIRKANLRLQHR